MHLQNISRPLFLAILIYQVILVVSLILLNLYYDGMLLTKAAYLHWDAEHYYSIKEHGYEGINIAFFPFFPLLWKVSQLSVFAVSALNGLVYLVSFFLLAKIIKLRPAEALLYLSIPSSIFYFLPYSESVFFANSLLIIIGLKNNKTHLVFIGLFLCSLSRPAFTVFFPALIIVEFLYHNWKVAIRHLSLYLIAILAGLVIVGYIQFLDTDKWFQFFSIQKHWGNYLQVPKLPLTSWGDDFIIRLDGVALLAGLLSGTFLAGYLLKLKPLRKFKVPKEVIFSLAYLGGITLSVLLFRGGSLFSLNRFVFTTPFIIVAASWFLNHPFKLKTKTLLLILPCIIAYWLFFGSWMHIQLFLMYIPVSVYILLIFAMKIDHISTGKPLLILLLLLNFGFQLHLFFRFFINQWVS